MLSSCLPSPPLVPRVPVLWDGTSLLKMITDLGSLSLQDDGIKTTWAAYDSLLPLVKSRVSQAEGDPLSLKRMKEASP